MKITWFGHSCFRIETGNSVLLIDPFLKGNPIQSGVSGRRQRKGDVALTHGHDDMSETPPVCKLRDATLSQCSSSRCVGNRCKSSAHEHRDRASADRPDIYAGAPLFLVGRRHLGHPCGIAPNTENKTVYHMGDTDLFSYGALTSSIIRTSASCRLVTLHGARTAAYACKKFFRFSTVILPRNIPNHRPNGGRICCEMAGENVVCRR